MSEIINLNRARKAQSRAKDTRQAMENRVTHGRTKAEKVCALRDTARAVNTLEGHKRQT